MLADADAAALPDVQADVLAVQAAVPVGKTQQITAEKTVSSSF